MPAEERFDARGEPIRSELEEVLLELREEGCRIRLETTAGRSVDGIVADVPAARIGSPVAHLAANRSAEAEVWISLGHVVSVRRLGGGL